jgi:CheY-like chemotaxis protein
LDGVWQAQGFDVERLAAPGDADKPGDRAGPLVRFDTDGGPPAAKDGTGAEPGDVERGNGGDGMPFEKPHILLVEDEDSLRTVLVRVFVRAGYAVTAVSNGWAALRAVDTAEAPFDVIVTNSTLPLLDGATFIRDVRMRLPRQPIVQISGRERTPEEEHELESVPFLEKPFAVADLLRVIEALRE